MVLKVKIINCRSTLHIYHDLIGKQAILKEEMVLECKPYYKVYVPSTNETCNILRADTILEDDSLSLLKGIARQRLLVVNAQKHSRGELYSEVLSHTEQQKEIYAIISHILNNFQSARESHDYWLDRMTKMGWENGAVTNIEEKKDSRLIPYNALPSEVQIEDIYKFDITNNCLELIELVNV